MGIKYCGIELKGNEARVIGIESTSENYSIVSLPTDKFKIKDPANQQEIQAFTTAFKNFLTTQCFDQIGIKGRMTKGRFAGGSTSFKMEGIIQSLEFPVSIINGATLRSKVKDADIDVSTIQEFQIEALKVALVLMLNDSTTI